MTKLILAAAATALLGAAPAAAVSVFSIDATGGNTVSVPETGPGQLSLDFGLGSPTPITVVLATDAGDLGGIAFDSIIDSFFTTINNGNPLRSVTLTLVGGATFGTIGSITPAFGSVASAVLDATNTGFTITFAPAETFGFELGDVGSGGTDFTILTTGFSAGDTFTLVLNSTTVPEPASWALLIAGFGLVGAAQRRRRVVVAV